MAPPKPLTKFATQVAVFAVVAVLLMTGMCSALHVRDERLPDGTYCGDYAEGLVTGRLSTKMGSDTFDIYLEAFDDELVCKDEKYIYDPKTHTAVVPGASDPENCIGKALATNGLTLEVLYNPKTDVVTLDLGIAKIECEKCS